MRDLELREKKMNDVQATGDKLLRDGHPARKTLEVRLNALLQSILHCRNLNLNRYNSIIFILKRLICGDTNKTDLNCFQHTHHQYNSSLPCLPLQAFTAALQTQWSWILQLCCCIETHLKENTAYFQVSLPAHP